MQVGNVAFSERDDVHAGERKALEEAGCILLVAAEAIERFRHDDVDLLLERLAHHRLEAGPHDRRARDRMIGVLGGDVPTLALRKLAADAELVTDRCVPLVLRRVPGVDGDFHSRSSSTERSDSATAWSKASRAACRASRRTSASIDSSACPPTCGRRRVRRATPLVRARFRTGGQYRDPLRPRMITPR